MESRKIKTEVYRRKKGKSKAKTKNPGIEKFVKYLLTQRIELKKEIVKLFESNF